MNIIDQTIVGAIIEQGAVAVVAVILFVFYRKDVKQYTELWRAQSELVMRIVQENTAAITQNTEVVKSMHRRMDGRIERTP